MSQILDTLDVDFKKHHYAVIDRIDEADVETLGREQDALDQHDDGISNLAMRIEQVIAICSFTSGLGARKIASRRLSYLKNNLSAVSTAVQQNQQNSTCCTNIKSSYLTSRKSLETFAKLSYPLE